MKPICLLNRLEPYKEEVGTVQDNRYEEAGLLSPFEDSCKLINSLEEFLQLLSGRFIVVFLTRVHYCDDNNYLHSDNNQRSHRRVSSSSIKHRLCPQYNNSRRKVSIFTN